MKKAIVILLTGAMMMAAVACGSNSSSSAPAAETPAEETQTEETEETVMTCSHSGPIAADEGWRADLLEERCVTELTEEEYMAAEMDSEVVIRGAVQAKQAYYSQEDSGSANVYLQDENGGAYFLYNLPCTPKEYELLEIGKFIKVKGYKSEWSGEVEVIDAVWMFEDGEYIAEPEDVTALLGTDELIQKQNKFVSFKGVKIEPIGDEGAAFIYNYDGSGQEGDDLYFNVSVNGNTYTFTVESYLCGPDTPVYKAIKDLKVGDVVDLEGFLYWYEGPNPHITAVVAQ